MASQRFGIAKVGVRVHDPDLTTEEGARLGTLEDLHRTAVISGGTVEQSRPIGAEQVRIDDLQVFARLTR